MTLIKCPACGQTVLSVATTCPKCHHLLVQNPMQQGGESDLAECPRCGKMIHRRAVQCEFCGYPVRARRHARRVVWLALIAVVLATGAIAGYRLRSGAEMPPVAGESPPAAREPTPTDSSLRLPGVTAQPPNPEPSTAPTPPAVERAAPPNAQMRWTVNWANIRVARDTQSAVVRAVPPTTRVLVGALRNGWWEVYQDGVFVGYMAGDLLRPSPVDSMPG